jgi:hypothetical protein
LFRPKAIEKGGQWPAPKRDGVKSSRRRHREERSDAAIQRP